VSQTDLARRLYTQGLNLRESARAVGCSHSGVDVMLRGRQQRHAKPVTWTPRAGRLQAHEREEILLGSNAGESMTSIARRLGRSPFTVSREVKESGGRARYGVWPAHGKACENTKRAKPAKLAKGPLCVKVIQWLHAWYSPNEISHRLRLAYPDDKGMRVRHRTIN
jgi:IS30 family transposase